VGVAITINVVAEITEIITIGEEMTIEIIIPAAAEIIIIIIKEDMIAEMTEGIITEEIIIEGIKETKAAVDLLIEAVCTQTDKILEEMTIEDMIDVEMEVETRVVKENVEEIMIDMIVMIETIGAREMTEMTEIEIGIGIKRKSLQFNMR
jgi:hypothetical protein